MYEDGLWYVAVLVIIILVIIYFIGSCGETAHMESGNEFPGQLVATAAMQEEIAAGYNQPSNPAATDPYYGAMIDVASQENAWTTGDWSGVH